MTRLHAHIGTVRQLEILLAVYENGSITAASDALHLTQPTVSMQIRKLSEAIGTPVYQQHGRKLVFTDAGKAVVETARDVLDSFARLDMTLSDLRGLKAGTLKIAVVTTSKYFIPHLLGPFCERYPDVDIQFKVGNRQQTIDRLRNGEDDFYVFSHIPEDEDIEDIDFLPNPLVAIAPENHPLAGKSRIDISELENYPFLVREQGSGTRHAIEEFLKEHNTRLDVKMTIESNEAIKHSVAAGLGISILSSHTLAFDGSQGLTVLDVKQLPIDSNWHIVYLKSKRLSVIANTFLNYLHTEGQENMARKLKDI